jgi:hypothetical protein
MVIVSPVLPGEVVGKSRQGWRDATFTGERAGEASLAVLGWGRTG